MNIVSDVANPTVTLEESRLFHSMDRELYSILVLNLWRNPFESLQILGLWLWMEKSGFESVISKILSQPQDSINLLADEAVTCFDCINIHAHYPFHAKPIPLTKSLLENVSLRFFHKKRLTAPKEIQALVNDVYIPLLSDIIERANLCASGEIWTTIQSSSLTCQPTVIEPNPHPFSDEYWVQDLASLGIFEVTAPSQIMAQENEALVYERIMFATFSKGYPVFEPEIWEFFTMLLGNCIESIYMQEVGFNEQALYARIVFHNPSFIQRLLNGTNKAKFTINGKHVWMRKFVRNTGRLLS